MDISSAGVSTVYKMDLFTSSFGKLQKQKEGHVAKMSRNQQRLTDERNALERKNMGKQATSDTMIEINKRMRQQAREEGSNAAASSAAAPSADSAPNQIVVSTNKNQEGRVGTSSAILSNEQINAGTESISASAENASRQYYNSVAVSTEDVQVPASMEPSHPTMSALSLIHI